MCKTTFSLSFHDAEEACSKMGENGHLASITSFELNKILFDALYNSSLDFAWFGLTNEGLINGKKIFFCLFNISLYSIK